MTKSNNLLYRFLKTLDIGVTWSFRAEEDAQVIEAVKSYSNLISFFKNIGKVPDEQNAKSAIEKIRIFIDNSQCFQTEENSQFFGI